MAFSTDVQTGVIGGLVTDIITKAAVPVKVVLYPDFEKLADLPGGADDSGALMVGADKTVPLVTIADTSAAADTSSALWGYVCDGTCEWKITVIGDGDQITPGKFTYREVVTSLDESITYFDGSVNVPAGSTVWPSSTSVKTAPSSGQTKTTVNLTVVDGGGGDGGPITADQITDATDYAVTLIKTAESPDGLRDAIGAKPGDYEPAAADISDSNAFSQSILTDVTDDETLRTKAGAGAFGSDLFLTADQAAALTALGLTDAAARLAAAEAAVATATLTIIESAGAYSVPSGNVRPIIFVGADNPGALMDSAKDVWLATT